MSWSSRRGILVLSLVGTLLGVSLAGALYAQKFIQPIGGPPGVGAPGVPGVPLKKPAYDLGSLKLPMDEKAAESIDYALDNIKSKNWDLACEIIQTKLMGRSDDVWAPIKRKAADGTEVTVYVSVKQEGGRMLANLPKETFENAR